MYWGLIFKTVDNSASSTEITRKCWLINISENVVLSIYCLISVVIIMPLWQDIISSLGTTLAERAGSLRAPEVVWYCTFHPWTRYFLDTDSQPVCQASHVRLSCNVSSNYFSLLDDLLRLQGCCCCCCCLLIICRACKHPAELISLGSTLHLKRACAHWLGTVSLGSPWKQGMSPRVSTAPLYPCWC